jgi:YHS domain-containing protein
MNSITDEEKEAMPIDPVCYMEVEEKSAAGQSTYQGKTYYFCAPGCREAFEKDPERYVPQQTDLLGRKNHLGR